MPSHLDLSSFADFSSSWKCTLNLRVSLVHLVSELLRVCVIFADSDKIDLQLERTVGFICQSKSDSVDLENTRSCTLWGYPNVSHCFMWGWSVSVRPCPARAGAEHPGPSHDWWGRTWRKGSGREAAVSNQCSCTLVFSDWLSPPSPPASRARLWCRGNKSKCHLSGERSRFPGQHWSSRGGHRHARADAACWKTTSRSTFSC